MTNEVRHGRRVDERSTMFSATPFVQIPFQDSAAFMQMDFNKFVLHVNSVENMILIGVFLRASRASLLSLYIVRYAVHDVLHVLIAFRTRLFAIAGLFLSLSLSVPLVVCASARVFSSFNSMNKTFCNSSVCVLFRCVFLRCCSARLIDVCRWVFIVPPKVEKDVNNYT